MKYYTRLKITLGYILIIASMSGALYIAYSTYKSLISSVSEISLPDKEISKINKLINLVSVAENKMRIYSLVKEDKYLHACKNDIKGILCHIDSLKFYNQKDSLAHLYLDSIHSLLVTRVIHLNSFVRYKRKIEQETYSSSDIKEYQKEVSDSITTKVKTTTTTKTYFDTIVHEKKIKEKRKGFFARLFSKKESFKVDTLKSIIKRTDIKVDSSINVEPDSVLFQFVDLVTDAVNKHSEMKIKLIRKELGLIIEGRSLWSKINILVERFENKRIEQNKSRANNAKKTAQKSILFISLIISLGLVIGILFLIFVFRDISKRNFYRKELIDAKLKAESLAKTKEEFLATMSHEIRTPLNSIVGFTNQLEKTDFSEKQEKYISILKTSSNHLLNLVNDILDLSKIEAGKLRLERISFSPQQLVLDVYNLMKTNAIQKEIGFNNSIEGFTKLKLMGDPFRIRQILLNLCSNAIKFTEIGKVDIVAKILREEDKFRFEIQVIDTGIGIQENKLEKIFDNFNQADTNLARKFGGTGLGLSISRRLTNMMGGELKASSTYGEGSCFSFSFIMDEAKDEKLESTTNNELNLDQIKSSKILVVDDHEYSLLLFKTIFEYWGIDAEFFNCSELAWKDFISKKYDIVISDFNMPKITGVEFCKLIRESSDNQDIPFILVTANIRESEKERYKDLNISDYLIKPVDDIKLLSLLNKHLTKSSNKLIENIKESRITKKIEKIKESSPRIKENKDYCIEELIKFTGNQQELIANILVEFISSTKNQISELRRLNKVQENEKLGQLAHRMLSSYRQLKINKIIENLAELEDILHGSEIEQGRINILVDKVIIKSREVIKQIEQDLNSM
ncbi:MAG: ATP-binding protein [Marinifilaceae bacterium]|jgi:signal transduction histidine kinase/DNA-binding response OmpR family regulator|nr:ATP-binding protein [Marinifilaceae bacterium]